MCLMRMCLVSFLLCVFVSSVLSDDVKTTETYTRIKKCIDSVPSINTHDHLMPFDQIRHRNKTERGEGMTLRSIWAGSYFTWIHPLENGRKTVRSILGGQRLSTTLPTPRRPASTATCCRRSVTCTMSTLTRSLLSKLVRLNDRIFENYKDDRWLHEVITERANIELMVIDPYWARLACTKDYPFAVPLCNVTSVVRGFHASEFNDPLDDPYAFAKQQGLEVNGLDDYVAVLDRLLAEAEQKGAICLKTTLAYNRTIRFENVPKERAAKAFGRPRDELSEQEIKCFEDYIMWRLVELSAKHASAVSNSHGTGPNPGFEPDVAGRLDRSESQDEVRACFTAASPGLEKQA